MDVRQGEPVTETYQKFYRSKSKAILESHPAPLPTLNETVSKPPEPEGEGLISALVKDPQFDAIESTLWGLMGAEHLETVREEIVLEQGTGAPGEQDRMGSLCSRAVKKAKSGEYDGGLALLLDAGRTVSVVKTMETYRVWASAVFQVLDLEARRKGQKKVSRLITALDGKAGEQRESIDEEEEEEDKAKWNWTEETFAQGSGGERIGRLVDQARKMKVCFVASSLQHLHPLTFLFRKQTDGISTHLGFAAHPSSARDRTHSKPLWPPPTWDGASGRRSYRPR